MNIAVVGLSVVLSLMHAGPAAAQSLEQTSERARLLLNTQSGPQPHVHLVGSVHLNIVSSARDGADAVVKLSNGWIVRMPEKGAPKISAAGAAIDLTPDRWMSQGAYAVIYDTEDGVLRIRWQASASYVNIYQSGVALLNYWCHHHNDIFPHFVSPEGMKMVVVPTRDEQQLEITGIEKPVSCERFDCQKIADAFRAGKIKSAADVKLEPAR